MAPPTALNDLRAILGNDVAMKAYREGKLPFSKCLHLYQNPK